MVTAKPLKRIVSLRYKKVSFLRRRALSAVLSRFARVRRPAVVPGEDPLRAFESLGGHHESADRQVLRHLRDALRERGCLRKALEVAQGIPGRDGARVASLIAGEIAVLSGEFTPAVRGGLFEPVPGRVLHLVGNSLPYVQSGYTLRTHYTALTQKAAGLDPHVVTQLGFGYYGVDEIDGVRYHRLPGQGRGTEPLDVWLQSHAEATARLTARLRPAVVHAASDFINAVTALAVGRAFGIPVVYESRGFWEETWLQRQEHRFGVQAEKPDIYLWRREMEDRCRREADAVVTLAEVMADRIEAGGVPRERITVVPNGVDTGSFPLLQRDRGLAGRLGIGEDEKVIGYISSIVPYEGIDTLVEAFARVREDSAVPVRLLVVGDGAEREPLLRQARALGLTEAVFTGAVPHTEVLGYYSLIDLFVVPRKPVEVCHLVTPLKPFEAFSTGRTVVLSDVRALAAIANDSGAAELFTAGDLESLAGVLRKLLSNPDRCRELAGRGAEWVRKHRTWAANAGTYAQLYHRLGCLAGPRQATAP